MILISDLAAGLAALRDRVFAGPSFEWGTVLAVSPLTVCTDIDPTPVPGVSSLVAVAVGDRVRLERQGPRVTITGIAGGGTENTIIVDGERHDASGTFTTSSLTMSASGNIFTANIQSYMNALPAAPAGWVRVPSIARGAGNSTWVTNASGQWFVAGSTNAARAVTVAWQLFQDG